MRDDETESNLPVVTGFSFKGGAGKTTPLALLGSAALVSGYRVIFIDTDATKNLTAWRDAAVQNGYWPDSAQLHHTLDEARVIEIIDDAYYARSADLVLLDTPGFETRHWISCWLCRTLSCRPCSCRSLTLSLPPPHGTG